MLCHGRAEHMYNYYAGFVQCREMHPSSILFCTPTPLWSHLNLALVALHSLLEPLPVQDFIHLLHRGTLPPPTVIALLEFVPSIRRRLQTLPFPDIRLHTHTMVLMFLQKRQPRLHNIGMSILDLDQPPHGDALKVLLTLFEHEVCAWDSPALGDSG
jgi:hypothetical protein